MSIRSIQVFSESPADTVLVGERIGAALRGGHLVALLGDLGAGKTTLTRGIAQGLGCPSPQEVNSPTFVLMQHYRCPEVVVNHIDAYRLESGWDLIEMGAEDLFEADRVTLIEWPEKVPDLLEGPHLEIVLETVGAERRSIVIRGRNDLPKLDLEKISESLGERVAGEAPGGPVSGES